MKVEKDKVVAIDYILKDEDGNEIDSSVKTGPLEYLHGHKNLIPGLEKFLEGKNPGDKFSVLIDPVEAYGDYDPKLVSEVDRKQFDADIDIKVGMAFYADSNDGPITVRVTKITDDKITVDANHELAGKTLYFDVEVKGVVDATPEQIAAGSVYPGCGGCSCGGGCDGGCGGDFSDDEGCSGGCGNCRG